MGTPTDASYLNALAPIGTQQKAGSSGSLGPFAELPSAGGPDASWLDSASENSVANVAAKTTDKGYRALVSRINITSYSILNRLHTCARAFALDKIKATRELKAALP